MLPGSEDPEFQQSPGWQQAELADHDAKDLLVLVPEDPWLGTVKNASTPVLGLGDTCVPAVSKGLWNAFW